MPVGSIETRLAVAFTGGIALAVYESGIAIELLELVRRRGKYAHMPAELGDIQVDIITGTSAGGLNGALLATALVRGGNLSALTALWLNEGDFGTLLYRKASNPHSFLNGPWFRSKLLSALQDASQGGEKACRHMDLFITSTNLDGDVFNIETAGGLLPVKTFRQALHFQYRDGEFGEPWTDDFSTPDDLRRLSIAARASASFPVAFAPVMLSRADFNPEGGARSIARYLNSDACHCDGGLLDNRPIDFAVNAIAHRPASGPVNRMLFFVEPDPENLRPDGRDHKCDADGECPRCVADVAFKGLFTISTYQSMVTALEDLAEQNIAVRERLQVLEFYERALSASRKWREGFSLPELHAQDPTLRRYITDSGSSAGWYASFEDTYLDLRLRQIPSSSVPPGRVPRDEDPPGIGQLLQRLSRIPSSTNLPTGATPEGIYRLRRLILDRFDLLYYQRQYRYLADLVRMAEVVPTASGDAPLFVEALSAIKREIYGAATRIVVRTRDLQPQIRAATGEMEQSIAQAIAAVEASPADTIPTLERHLDNLENYLRGHRLLADNWNFLEQLRLTVYNRIRAEQEKAEPQLRGEYKDRLLDLSWKLRDALDAFFLRDMLLFPLTMDSDFARELNKVKFARISPADAPTGTAEIPANVSAHDKLAGDILGHFGGFMKREWRQRHPLGKAGCI